MPRQLLWGTDRNISSMGPVQRLACSSAKGPSRSTETGKNRSELRVLYMNALWHTRQTTHQADDTPGSRMHSGTPGRRRRQGRQPCGARQAEGGGGQRPSTCALASHAPEGCCAALGAVPRPDTHLHRLLVAGTEHASHGAANAARGVRQVHGWVLGPAQRMAARLRCGTCQRFG